MKTWVAPTVTVCKMADLKKVIQARAWSVGQAMEMGEFLDQCNASSVGTVYMAENPGHMIQVEVIGWIFATLVTLRSRLGEIFSYQKINGSWVRNY